MYDQSKAPEGTLFHDEQPGGREVLRRPSLLKLLRGRTHWAIILALLFGIAGAIYGYQHLDPIYRSTGQIRISPDLRPVLTQTDLHRQIPHYDSYLDAQVSLMRSRQVIERAVQQESWQRLGRGDSEAHLRYFSSNLDVVRPRNSQIAELRFYDEDPNAAAASVIAAIQAFNSVYREQHAQRDAQIHNQLQERHRQLTQELAQLREARDAVAGRYGVEGLVRRYQLQLEQLSELQQHLRTTRIQLQAMREHEAQQGDLPAPVTLEQIAQQDETMREMLNQRQQVEDYIDANLRLGLGERHRELSRSRVELDALNQRIEAYASRFSAADLARPVFRFSLDPTMPDMVEPLTLVDLEARERDLEQLHEQVQNEAAELGARQQRIDDLQERIEQRRVDLAETAQRIDSLNIETPLASRVEVISWGETPTVPYNQGQRVQYAGFGAAAGALLGIGLIMLIGRLDRRVQHIEDAQDNLPAARLLGILPTLPPNLAASEKTALAAHCVHHIRTLLQLGAPGKQSQVIAVTSPAAGSGKTSLSTALGLSFATSEARTLLIDCDVVGAGLSQRLNAIARPSLARILKDHRMVDAADIDEARKHAQATGKSLGEVLVERGRLSRDQLNHARMLSEESSLGLLDVCEGEPMANCIADIGITNLAILPVGRARPHQAGVLSPAALKRVFDQARNQYDIVLVDTGPMPGSIEASMAASEADRTILVVSRGDEKALALRSLEHLRGIDASLAGIVFNHALPRDVQQDTYLSTVSGNGDFRSATVMSGADSDRFDTAGGPAVGSASNENTRQG